MNPYEQLAAELGPTLRRYKSGRTSTANAKYMRAYRARQIAAGRRSDGKPRTRITSADILKALWIEAYKSSHVLADITEKHDAGRPMKPQDAKWLMTTAKEMLQTARQIKRKTK